MLRDMQGEDKNSEFEKIKLSLLEEEI